MIGRLAALAAGFTLAISTAATAQAHSRVQVQLTDSAGRPVDGTVTMTGPATLSCRTTAARCTITAPAGTYRVTLRPVRGTAPAPRTLRVPASGTTSLALRAGAPSIRATAGVTARTGAIRTATPTGRATVSGARPATRTGRTVAGRTGAVRTTAGAATVRAAGGLITRSGTRPTAVARAGTSGSGATSGGSGSTTATPTVRASGSVQQRAGTIAARDLTSGRRLCVQGSVMDGAGRPTDAVLTFSRGSTVVGTARTTAGRFSIYDLSAGTYSVSLRSSRGSQGRGSVTVGSTQSRVVLRVP